MKLRIRGDSVRLRLRQPEVLALLEEGFVEENTAFGPDAVLIYLVEIAGTQLRATLNANLLRITLPRPLVTQWATTDQIGITAEQPAGSGRTLKILVEKDFVCKEGNSDESQEGAFENPASSTKC